jgi:hypothetical protein
VHTFREERLRYPIWADAGAATFRALRSIVVVMAVALIVRSVLDGGINWSKLARMVVHNRVLFIMVFLGLMVWEFWHRRTKRHHALDSKDAS